LEESFPKIYGPNAEPDGVFAALRKIHKNIQDIPGVEENGSKLTELIESNLDEAINRSNPITGDMNAWTSRPFGSFGDDSLNNIASRIINLDYKIITDNADIIIQPLSLVPAGIMYTSLVRLYVNRIVPMEPINQFVRSKDKMQFIRLRNAHIRTFMLITAPLITVGLLHVLDHSIFNSVSFSLHENLSSETDVSSDMSSSVLKKIGFFILGHNSQKKNRGSWTKWIKVIMSIFISIGILVYCIGLDSLLVFILSIKLKYFILVYILFILFFIMYYMFIIFLYFLFRQNEINIPAWLPPFMKEGLTGIKILSRSHALWYIIRMCLIQLLSLSFGLCMFIYYYY